MGEFGRGSAAAPYPDVMGMNVEERLSFHCERLAHPRCVSRGCSCFCHERGPQAAKPPPHVDPRPMVPVPPARRPIAPRVDGRHNNRGRPALTDEERATRRAEINAQRRAAGEGFSSDEIQELTGLTYRQIDYWCRTGVMIPSLMQANGSGTQRRWSDADLRVLLVAKQLIDAGLSLASVRGIGDKLRDLPAGTEGYALIDADQIRVVRSLPEITAALASGRVVHVMRIEP